jgi:hypothetical protein
MPTRCGNLAAALYADWAAAIFQDCIMPGLEYIFDRQTKRVFGFLLPSAKGWVAYSETGRPLGLFDNLDDAAKAVDAAHQSSTN